MRGWEVEDDERLDAIVFRGGLSGIRDRPFRWHG
jgi:hypothetical protein